MNTNITGVAAASNPAPEKLVVEVQLKQLERELNFVCQAVQDLEGQLAPLLSPEVESVSTAEERVRHASLSPLGGQIFELTGYAQYIVNRISAIRSRL